MKKYEALFILNTSGIEDGIQEAIDRVSDEMGKLGANIESVQKMEKRAFSRVANKKYNSGFYVNYIFEIEPEQVGEIQRKFKNSEEVFRIFVSNKTTESFLEK